MKRLLLACFCLSAGFALSADPIRLSASALPINLVKDKEVGADIVKANMIEANTVEANISGASGMYWRAEGERLNVQLLENRMDAWGLGVGLSGTRSSFTMDLGARELRFLAPAGLFKQALDGGFDLASGLQMQIRGRKFTLNGAALVATQSDPLTFALVDADGAVWWQFQNIHHVLDLAAKRLSLRNMDVRVGPALAKALGNLRLTGEQMGYGVIEAKLTARQSTALRENRCATPNWPMPGQPGDVGLVALNAFQFMRGRNIDGPGGQDGEMVVAPDAYLRNVGNKDIPWYSKFSGVFPPYGNDQHPMLVWSMYRIDQNGELRQITRSGVKHAFLTINDGCDCTNFHILGLNCGDVYAAGNNDTPGSGNCLFADGCDLGPRNEIDPRSAVWGRCGSIYDPNCDGQPIDVQNYGPYEHRLVVRESALDPALNPGASYYFDGWYVVRDDGNIFNSMGHAKLKPLYLADAQQWLFNNEVGPFQNGTVLERWQAHPPTPTARTLSTVERPEGFVQVGVRVVPGTSRAWRYQYVVLNLDWMQSTFVGAAPNQRLTRSIGLTQLSIPNAPANVANQRFFDGDETAANDWTQQIQLGSMLWSAPSGTSQPWASAYTFGFESDAAPVPGQVQLSGGANSAVQFFVNSVVPFSQLIFASGFED